MAGRSVILGVLCAAALLAAPARAADEPPSKEPGPKATGKIYTWKAADGLAYDFYLPKSYDPGKGITLTLILHGSNGWKGWGFSMHKAGDFRPDDFVVSPEGTTPNGKGGFNSLQSDADLQRFHALHMELKKLVKVNATYIYGLSQGSFFAHFYAGHHGEDVQGIVAHGSAWWYGSGSKKQNHHQAIAVMHGRYDPIYTYGGGVSAYERYTELKYPLRKFRSLQLNIHWAPWGHQAQQLAWCEGMTSNDPGRVVASFEWLENVKDSDGWFRDPVAAYQVAKRLVKLKDAPAKAKTRATKMIAKIEGVAAKHVTAIEASKTKTKGKVTGSATWPAHARLFLRDWQGIPAGDEFAKKWRSTSKKHLAAAKKAWKDYYAELKKGNKSKAMSAAMGGVEKGFLHYWCVDADMLQNIETWRGDAKKNKIPSAAVKKFDKVVQPFLAARKKGEKAYADLNRKL